MGTMESDGGNVEASVCVIVREAAMSSLMPIMSCTSCTRGAVKHAVEGQTLFKG